MNCDFGIEIIIKSSFEDTYDQQSIEFYSFGLRLLYTACLHISMPCWQLTDIVKFQQIK